jgi:TonB family protein
LLGAGFAKSVCKILMAKSLEVKILTANALAVRSLVSGDRHCLDNGCAIADWAQGQMSQCSCGKKGGGLRRFLNCLCNQQRSYFFSVETQAPAAASYTLRLGGVMRRSKWLAGILGIFVAASAAQVAEPPQKLPVVKSGEMPFYPPLPRMAHVEGEVQLRVTTDGSGVASVVVESGQPMLARAAQDNVRTWKFEPHKPTSFSTLFSYHLLTEFKCEPGKPNNGEFHIKLPTEVEVTASTTLRDAYCDPTQGLDLSEPLRVFLTGCEVDGSSVPCEKLTIRLHSGSFEPLRTSP